MLFRKKFFVRAIVKSASAAKKTLPFSLKMATFSAIAKFSAKPITAAESVLFGATKAMTSSTDVCSAERFSRL